VLATDYGEGAARYRVLLPTKHLARVRREGGRVVEGAPPEPEPE
jgi:hypothetical protein